MPDTTKRAAPISVRPTLELRAALERRALTSSIIARDLLRYYQSLDAAMITLSLDAARIVTVAVRETPASAGFSEWVATLAETIKADPSGNGGGLLSLLENLAPDELGTGLVLLALRDAGERYWLERERSPGRTFAQLAKRVGLVV